MTAKVYSSSFRQSEKISGAFGINDRPSKITMVGLGSFPALSLADARALRANYLWVAGHAVGCSGFVRLFLQRNRVNT
jgi:hypothetical protein